MQHPYFGEIELDEGFAELPSIETGDREIVVEIDCEDRSPTEPELAALAQACQSHESWTAKIVTRAVVEFDDLLRDALSVWSEDDTSFLKHFNPDANDVNDVTAEQVISRLQLSDIRMEVGDTCEIAMDLQFDLPDAINYLICGRFRCDGQLDAVTLES